MLKNERYTRRASQLHSKYNAKPLRADHASEGWQHIITAHQLHNDFVEEIHRHQTALAIGKGTAHALTRRHKDSVC